VSEESIEFIAKQLKIDKKTYLNYNFNSRNAFFHKKQIREELCFREYSKNDMESIKEWLIQIVLPVNDDIEYLKQQLYKRFYEIKIESTTEETLDRIVSSAINTYENNMFENIFNKLPVETIRKFNLFIAIESENNNTEQTIWFNDFSINPDGPNIESVFNESNKLKTIENMMIPEDIFKDIPPKYLKKYYKPSKSENVSEFKRHPDVIRNVLLSVFFHFKSMEIKDNLVDLLIKILNNLDTYDQMVKYATALRLGTADAESILKKFTKNNLQHPTYQALSELGRAIKTIFICRYIMSEEMRIEINQGLNVIENWNSANNFIFCARGREFSTNNIEDQEVSALALHLIQNCMVYVNTLLIQDILSEEEWFNSMEKEDFRAITPLIYSHINPYGNFNLDMDKRIHLGVQKNVC
jgi:hypothetical protein